MDTTYRKPLGTGGGPGARERALPERVADEERAERLDVLRGLDGLAHGLDQVRERVEVRT